MELLKWVVFFTELQSDPTLNSTNVHDKIQNKLKAFENGSEYRKTVILHNDKFQSYSSFEYASCNSINLNNLFEFTANLGYLDIFKCLIEDKARNDGITVNEAVGNFKGDIYRALPLIHMVIKVGHLDLLKYLIKLNVSNLLKRDREGNTLLHTAAYYSQLRIVTYLTDGEKFDVNVANTHGLTASHKAAEGGSLDIIKCLKEKGANTSAVDNTGATMLYHAACNGKLEILKYLIEEEHQYLDINTENLAMTPLQCASRHGHLDVVKYLITHNADLYKRNHDGNIAIHFTTGLYSLHVLKYFIDELHADINIENFYGETVLHKAVRYFTTNIDLIRYLVGDKKMNIDYADKSGNTPIHKAVLSRSIKTIKYLLGEKGGDLFVTNKNEKSALQIAMGNYYLDKSIIIYLFSEEANRKVTVKLQKWIDLFAEIESDLTLNNVNVFDKIESKLKLFENGSIYRQWLNGDGVFMKDRRFPYKAKEISDEIPDVIGYPNLIEFSARYGFLNMFKYMLEHKADEESITVNDVIFSMLTDLEQNREGSLIHLAVKNGDLDTIKYIFNIIEIYPMIDDVNRKTPLHFAAKYGKFNILKYLVEEQMVSIDTRDLNWCTALHEAATKGYLDILKYLQEKGGDIRAEDKKGWTLMHHAAFNGHLSVIKYLHEEKDINLNEYVEYTDTSLKCAIDGGHLHVVKFILDQSKTNLSEVYFGKYSTALHTAAEKGQLDIVRYLVDEKNMSIYAEDINKATPFQICARQSHKASIDILKYFVEEKGANLSYVDKEGLMAQQYAARGENYETSNYLLSKKVDVNVMDREGETILHDSVNRRNLKLLKLFIEVGEAKVDSVDNKQRSILHLACVKQDFEIVKYLVEMRKMNVNQVDNEKRTPLYYAAETGNYAIVKYLVENGADVNIEDKFGFTAADSAAMCERDHFKAVVEYLHSQQNFEKHKHDESLKN